MVPPVMGIVEVAFQATAGADGVGDAVAVKVHQVNFRVFETKAGYGPVAPERTVIPEPTELQRVIAGLSLRADQQINPTVAVGIQHLHTRVCEAQSSWGLTHLLWQREC